MMRSLWCASLAVKAFTLVKASSSPGNLVYPGKDALRLSTPQVTYAPSAAPTAAPTYAPTAAPVCGGGEEAIFLPVEWSSEDGEIKANGKTLHIKGVSWPGFEGANAIAEGLYAANLSTFLDFVRYYDINALRIPISVQLSLNESYEHGQYCVDGCPATSWGVLDELFVGAADRGIVIALDMHRIDPDYNTAPSGLWTGFGYSQDDLAEAWNNLVSHYKQYWNFFAADLFNEPHNVSSWGIDPKRNRWDLEAIRLIDNITATNPDWPGLFLVEGVEWRTPYPFEIPTSDQYAHTTGYWWGGDLQGVWSSPIETGDKSVDSRVVYSPHVYGPDVFIQAYFNSSSYPANMPEIWDKDFGFVEQETGRASIIGEWGGKYSESERSKNWTDTISVYLKSICQSDNFYWSLTPNSVDTGGLIASTNFTDPETGALVPDLAKLQVLAELQPHPSFFAPPPEGYSSSELLCLSPGNYANPACSDGTPNIRGANASEPSGATPLPAADGYQMLSLGCWADAFDPRDINGSVVVKAGLLTPQICATSCALGGYSIMGLQAGTTCYCGDSYGSYSQLPSYQHCYFLCPGDASETCGGLWANEVSSVTDYRLEYKGCYEDKDTAGARDLAGASIGAGNMTVVECASFCHNGEFTYAGLQEGRKCFCGTNYGAYGSLAEKECLEPCSGDDSQACGGSLANSIYRIYSLPTSG